MLNILRERKGKSIAGDDPSTSRAFRIENDVIGSEQDHYSMQMVKFSSAKDLTYFRGKDDELAKFDVKEEEIIAMKLIA